MKPETTGEYLHRIGSAAIGISPQETKGARGLKFPIKFKVFLRLAIGLRSYTERLPIFRKYWVEMLRHYADLGSTPPAGDDNKTEEGRKVMAAKIIAKYNREGIDEIDYHHHKAAILVWRRRNRIQQRKNAANSRWEKEKARKAIDGTPKPQK